MIWFFRILRLFRAQSRRGEVRNNLKDSLLVERERVKSQSSAADYWVQRDLRETRSVKDKP